MYYVSQTGLFMLALRSALLGVFFGAVWDLFRIFRIAQRGTVKAGAGAFRRALAFFFEQFETVAVFLQDMIFFMFAGVCMCIFLYRYDSGRIRGLSLFCTAGGFALYFFTVGRLVIAVAEKTVAFIRRLIKTLYKYSLRPFFRAVRKILSYIIRLFYKKHLTNRTKSYIKVIGKSAADGFGIDVFLKGG